MSNKLTDFSFACIVLVDTDAPRDTQAEKHPADVVEGGSVTLKCVANGRPDPNFTWFGNENKEIGRGAEHKITLIVESQSGEYHCEATNKLGTMKSNPVNINVTCEYIIIIILLNNCCQLE